MKVGMRRFFVAGLAAFAGLALAAPSYAAFEIDVTEFGGPTIPIIDGGPLDQDGLANGVINVLTGALNPLLVNYSFTSLGGDSNALTGGGSDDASISQTGQVSLLTGGTGSITIVARETNFLFPSGGSGSMTTSASDTFRSRAAGANRTFQSTFTGPPTNSALLAFIPPNGTGPFSTSNPGVVTPLGPITPAFGLSNTTVINLVTPASGVSSDQFTGATTVMAAIPEPTSIALVGIGLAATAFSRFRRRMPRA